MTGKPGRSGGSNRMRSRGAAPAPPAEPHRWPWEVPGEDGKLPKWPRDKLEDEVRRTLAEWGAIRHPAHGEFAVQMANAAVQMANALDERAYCMRFMQARPGRSRLPDERPVRRTLAQADVRVSATMKALRLWPTDPPPPPDDGEPEETF